MNSNIPQKKQNQYDEKVKDYFQSRTFKITMGCIIALIVFPFIAMCCALIVAPAFTNAIMKGLGLQ